MENKIKVSAPRKNPHICYIPEDRREKIEEIKKLTGKSLYRILCEVSGSKLQEKSDIQKFKQQVKKEGYKNIGDWATYLIDLLYEFRENLPDFDLSLFKIH